VKKVLREERLGPAGTCKGPSWREFLRTQAKSAIAVDFFTVDTVGLQRLYALFFIEIASRRVHLAGCTANPDSEWVTQQARHVAWTLAERADPVRFLIRDHDRKFTRRFDLVFEAQGTHIIRTPIQVPEANGIAERFVRTVRSECLDWLLILNARHLRRTLTVFIDHYNRFRPHRSLGLKPPNGRPPIENWEGLQPLDHVLFWNAHDLERKLAEFQAYYNAARCHASLKGHTPLTFADGHAVARADLSHVRWVSHCRDLVQLPVAA
jgi:hypothetical protein